jgi:GGDEF domain-containing protein
MPAALPSRRLLALLSVLAFAWVSVLFFVLDRNGLGLGHYYYVAVAFAALAGGLQVGASAGALASALYPVGVLVNPHLSSSTALTFGTLVRATTLISIGALVGWFADRHRQLVGELSVLADRDVLTGLPNTRAFEAAINRRFEAADEFTLFVGELAQRAEAGGPASADDALRPLADRLLLSLDPTDEIARLGESEFAVLVRQSPGQAGRFAGKLEAWSPGQLTFGWACYPGDGDNALSLYRAASERFYARRLVRELDARQKQGAASPVASLPL